MQEREKRLMSVKLFGAVLSKNKYALLTRLFQVTIKHCAGGRLWKFI